MVYVFLANGFEETEAIAPIDILRRAELDVTTVGVGGKMITGAHGIQVTADIDQTDASIEDVDMIVLPGGIPGTLNLEKSQIVQSFIDFCAQHNKWIAAICAAPSILGHKGLLDNRQFTCFPGYESEAPAGIYRADGVIRDQNIITASGAGVALSFGFELVSALCSTERAEAIKSAMQCRNLI